MAPVSKTDEDNTLEGSTPSPSAMKMDEKAKEARALMTKEDRQVIADSTPYEWEICAVCGASEKEYFLETGFDMLTWHPKPGVMCCEYCIGDYPE